MSDYYRRNRKGRITPADPTDTPPVLNDLHVKSFEEAKNLYISKCKGDRLSEFTIKHYSECIDSIVNIFKILNITLDPSLVTEEDMNRYRSYMVENDYEAETINGRIRVARRFFAWLHGQGLIQSNPALRLTKVRGEQKMIQTFSLDQVNDLLRQPDTRYFWGLRDKTIMTLLFDTGIRLVGITNLELDNLDLKNGYLRRVLEKGREREIPISPRTCNELRKYLTARGTCPTNKVFVSRDGAPLKRRSIQDALSKYGRKAEIVGVRVSAHTYRHSMAKFYILKGGDPISLQNILGHTSMDMIRVYVRLWSAETKMQHNKFSPLNDL